jgi:AraC-like DNA-binding protein
MEHGSSDRQAFRDQVVRGRAAPEPVDPEPAVLGQAFGAYDERPASPLLRPHFAGVWFHWIPAGAPRRSAIAPDGCADLIFVGGTLRIAGPDREAKVESIPQGTTVVGLRFQPGAASSWLQVSVSEIVGARLPLEDFWGSEARRLADWVGEGRTPEGVAARLETALAHRARVLDAPDEIPRAIFRTVAATRPGEAVVGHLADRLGMSERTLRRRCREAFGYGPKTLDRILRFQRFMALARRPGAGGPADLAVAAGYADQPHLTRETRQLSGLTPGTILRQLSG